MICRLLTRYCDDMELCEGQDDARCKIRSVLNPNSASFNYPTRSVTMTEKLDAFASQLEGVFTNEMRTMFSTRRLRHSSFPNSMFDIEGYSLPFRCDGDLNGGGILVYVKEGIPCRELNIKPGAERVEGIFLEINPGKQNGYFLQVIIILSVT